MTLLECLFKRQSNSLLHPASIIQYPPDPTAPPKARYSIFGHTTPWDALYGFRPVAVLNPDMLSEYRPMEYSPPIALHPSTWSAPQTHIVDAGHLYVQESQKLKGTHRASSVPVGYLHAGLSQKFPSLWQQSMGYINSVDEQSSGAGKEAMYTSLLPFSRLEFAITRHARIQLLIDLTEDIDRLDMHAVADGAFAIVYVAQHRKERVSNMLFIRPI
jgi:hypothetical protein